MITNFSYFPLIFKALKTIRGWEKRETVFVNVAKFNLNCKKKIGVRCTLKPFYV